MKYRSGRRAEYRAGRQKKRDAYPPRTTQPESSAASDVYKRQQQQQQQQQQSLHYGDGPLLLATGYHPIQGDFFKLLRASCSTQSQLSRPGWSGHLILDSGRPRKNKRAKTGAQDTYIRIYMYMC